MFFWGLVNKVIEFQGGTMVCTDMKQVSDLENG